MQQKHISQAARILVERRHKKMLSARLSKELRPETSEQALAIQQVVIDTIGDDVGGWKCSLPNTDNLIAAPIFSRTLCNQSPCHIELDNGACKIEPEIAFVFKDTMPAQSEAYSEESIVAALGGAHLVLELIRNRYLPAEEVSFPEHLADCLLNQGLYIGPSIDLQQALVTSDLEFTLSQTEVKVISGKHPNHYPKHPLIWLVNFLSQRGIDIQAGQIVTTGSYAGVLDVQPNLNFTLQFGELGTISLMFKV